MIDFDTIRKLREERNWTQEQMAEKLGLTRNGYAKIERGESMPNLQRLDGIADMLGVKVTQLLKLDKSVIVQTQNYEANYYQNYQNYQNSEQLKTEIGQLSNNIEKLQLIIRHKDELLAQKDKEIELLRRLLD